MIEGKTKSKFKFVINEDDINDMRFIDKLTQLKKGDFTALSELTDMLFGEEQKNKLYDHIAKNNNGKVKIDALANEINDVLTYQDETKN